jgi:hypothetical protein
VRGGIRNAFRSGINRMLDKRRRENEFATLTDQEVLLRERVLGEAFEESSGD